MRIAENIIIFEAKTSSLNHHGTGYGKSVLLSVSGIEEHDISMIIGQDGHTFFGIM